MFCTRSTCSLLSPPWLPLSLKGTLDRSFRRWLMGLSNPTPHSLAWRRHPGSGRHQLVLSRWLLARLIRLSSACAACGALAPGPWKIGSCSWRFGEFVVHGVIHCLRGGCIRSPRGAPQCNRFRERVANTSRPREFVSAVAGPSHGVQNRPAHNR
jgi:hypothetical protein